MLSAERNNMKTAVVIIILLIIIGAAVWYVCRAKKQGRRCIGCPGGTCCGCQK